MMVMAKDLKLADVVRVAGGPFATAIVSQVTDTEVKFFRPYGTTADFSYTGGVICYVGIEEWSVGRTEHEYEVLERRALR